MYKLIIKINKYKLCLFLTILLLYLINIRNKIILLYKIIQLIIGLLRSDQHQQKLYRRIRPNAK